MTLKQLLYRRQAKAGSGLPCLHRALPLATIRHRAGLQVLCWNRSSAGADKASSKAFRLSVLSTSSSNQRRATISSLGPPPPTPASGAPNFLVFALVSMFAAYVGKGLLGTWGRGQSRNVYEDRGSQSQRGHPRLRDVMKGVNTVPLPELSTEQISAARARRQKDRSVYKLSMDDVELPENHPWAMKAPGQQQDGLLNARMPRRFTQQQQQQQQQQPAAAPNNDRSRDWDSSREQQSTSRQSRGSMRGGNRDQPL